MKLDPQKITVIQ